MTEQLELELHVVDGWVVTYREQIDYGSWLEEDYYVDVLCVWHDDINDPKVPAIFFNRNYAQAYADRLNAGYPDIVYSVTAFSFADGVIPK